MAEETQTKTRQFEEEFKALPLDEKFCSLFRMEAATFEQSLKEVAKTGGEVFDKLGDVLNDFGRKVKDEFNKERASAADYAPPVTEADAAPGGGGDSDPETPASGRSKKK
jgi:hypothetical protein